MAKKKRIIFNSLYEATFKSKGVKLGETKRVSEEDIETLSRFCEQTGIKGDELKEVLILGWVDKIKGK